MEKEERRRTLKEILVSDYSFNQASLKWIPAGGEILEHIGQEVVYLDYTRKSPEDSWVVKTSRAYIQSIHDFEPLTGTYEIIFSLIDETGEAEDLLRRERIIPEGFSYNNPDLHNWMHRFVPYSLHFKLGEAESHYLRMVNLYSERPGMTMSEIKKLQTEDPKKKLGFFNNIQALIDTDVEGGLGVGLISFRIYEISEPKLLSKTWRFGLRDKSNNYFPIRLDKSDEENTMIRNWTLGDTLIGDLKILDISDPTKAEPIVEKVETGEENQIN